MNWGKTLSRKPHPKTTLFPNRFGPANRFAPKANRFGPKDLGFCLGPNRFGWGPNSDTQTWALATFRIDSVRGRIDSAYQKLRKWPFFSKSQNPKNPYNHLLTIYLQPKHISNIKTHHITEPN